MKKSLWTVLLCLFLTAIGFAQNEPSNPSAEVTAAITQLRTGLIDSFTKADIDRLVTYLDPDVVVTWQNGEVCHGRAEVRAFYQRMMTGENRVVREIKAEPEVIGRHVFGDWAVSWGNLHDRFVLTDGRDLPLNTVFTATIAKRGDRWLVTGFHASINAFDNPILRLAVHKTMLWTGVAAALVGLIVGILIGRRRNRTSDAT